jgi:hypothetical protein
VNEHKKRGRWESGKFQASLSFQSLKALTVKNTLFWERDMFYRNVVKFHRLLGISCPTVTVLYQLIFQMKLEKITANLSPTGRRRGHFIRLIFVEF